MLSIMTTHNTVSLTTFPELNEPISINHNLIFQLQEWSSESTIGASERVRRHRLHHHHYYYYHHQQAHGHAGDISSDSDGDVSIVSTNKFKSTM